MTEEKVYVVASGRTGRSNRVYHSRKCRYVKRARKVHERLLSHVDHRPECQACTRDLEITESSTDHYRSLLRAAEERAKEHCRVEDS